MELRQAVENGDYLLVIKLLEGKKLQANEENYDLLKLVLTEVKTSSDLLIWRSLADHGAPIVGFDKLGESTLLHLAAGVTKDLNKHFRYSDLKTVAFRMLKADVNVTAVNERNETPIHIAAKCENRQILEAMVKKLMRRRERLRNIVDHDGLSLFHIMCTMSNSNYVFAFLEQIPSISLDRAVRGTSKWCPGFTALHFAVLYYRQESIKFLIEAGADLAAVTTTGLTMLHVACVTKKCEWMIIEAVEDTKRSKLNVCREHFFKSLNALLEARILIIEMLLNFKLDVDAKDGYGNTSLMLVAFNGFQQIAINLHEFLNFIQSDVRFNNLRTNSELISKMYDEHNLSIVEILFEHYKKTKNMERAQVLSSKSNSGQSYYHYIAKQKSMNDQVVKLFLTISSDFNVFDDNYCIPLHLAIKYYNFSFRDALLPIENNALKSNLEQLVNVNAQDDLGNTPLHCVDSSKVSIINTRNIAVLLNYGADVYLENENGLDGFSIVRDYILNVMSNDEFTEVVDCFYDVVNVKFKKHFNMQQLPIAGIIPVWKDLIALNVRSDSVNAEFHQFLNDFSSKLLVKHKSVESSMNFESECEEEVSKMKAIRFNAHVTLYDLLIKNVNRVAAYTENADIKQFLESPDFEKQFSMYEKILKARFIQGLSRNKILDKAVEALAKLVQRHVPLLCIDKILSHLSEKKLRDIIEANARNESV